MRRSTGLLTLYTVVVLIVLFAAAGCGGKKSTTGAGVPATVTISPSTASINRGSTISFSATVQDSGGTTLSGQTITFQSSNTSVAQIATSGLACGGTWDSLANPVVCTPGATGTTQITAVSGGITSAPVTLSVHGKVDTVVVSPSVTNPCVSQGGTQQFTATAFSNGQDVTSTAGAFSWASTQTAVATVDANSGLATSVQPGQAGIFASAAGVNSLPATFTACPVQSISLVVQGSNATSFTVATGTTTTLTATAIDSSGATLTNPTLTFNRSAPAVGTVSGSAFTSVAPGTTSIVATCTPPACNTGLNKPIYSNVVLANVSGTSATTVFVAGTNSTSLIPIDTTTNVAGTAITLPQAPNSILAQPTGAHIYLGSSGGLISVDLTASNAVSVFPTIPGKVLAISPDGSSLLIFNAPTNTLRIFSTAANTVQSLSNISGVTRADFSSDGFKAFLVAGTTLYVFSPVLSLQTITLPSAANDAGSLASGAFEYLAGGAASSVTVRATCDNSLVDTVATPATPLFIKSLFDGSQVIAVDTTGVDALTPKITGTGCPPALSDTLKRTSFGVGTFNPTQLIITSDGLNAFVLSDAGLLVYKPQAVTAGKIALVGGAKPLSGGTTLDSTKLYVGGDDQNVHLVNVVSGADTNQITIGFVPDLVAVQPK
jgi:hypothetical protein